jgi:hypothetical protein
LDADAPAAAASEAAGAAAAGAGASAEAAGAAGAASSFLPQAARATANREAINRVFFMIFLQCLIKNGAMNNYR